MDLLEFIGSLILSEGEGINLGLDIFGLSLLQAALNAGAQALARCAAKPVQARSGLLLVTHPCVQLAVQDHGYHHRSSLSSRSEHVLLLGSITLHAGECQNPYQHSAGFLIWACDCRHEALLLLLRQDIWGALAMAACRPDLAALSHACQVYSLAQYSHLPRM